MKTQTLFLVATALIGLASCQGRLEKAQDVSKHPRSERVLQVSTVGYQILGVDLDGELSELVIDSVEADPQITVVDNSVELGGLLCDSLVDAQDASTLQFAISSTETIIADQTSYSEIPGDSFTGSAPRMVWAGVVTDPQPADSNMTVTMTWADPCSTETFLLTVMTEFADGTTSVRKSIPCPTVGETALCLVEVNIVFEEELEPVAIAVNDTAVDISSRRLRATPVGRPVQRRTKAYERKLQASTEISVMFLYSSEAMALLGPDITEEQMESFLTAGLALANEAMVNSGIAAEFVPAYFGLLPYDQETELVNALTSLTFNADVAALRDTHEADLVQLVGSFSGACGVAWQYNTLSNYGFSVSSPNCFFQYTHTNGFGINMGCIQERDSAIVQTDYSHGYRECDGSIPYRTIVTTACGEAHRINHFSSPDVDYLGFLPTGSATEDNARTIEDNMATVAAWRPLAPAPTPPPATPVPATPVPTTPAPATPVPTTPAPATPVPTTPAPATPVPTTPAPATPVPTTSQPVSSPVPTCDFLGCFVDSQANRVLSGPSYKSDPTMTSEVCAGLCEGYAYYGTQFGEECFCGEETDDPAELGATDTCVMPCSGDSSETCGGFNAISVYQCIDSGSTLLGCYGDVSTDRVMSVVTTDPAMTNELCAEICSEYPFYGTQYGVECWCGDETTDADKHGEATCDYECAGDAEQTCGGFFAISVYEF